MSTFDSISKYAVGNKANDEAYGDLRDVATSLYATNSPTDARNEFETITREGEIEFMDVNYGTDVDAVHLKGASKGSYKFRTYLPRAYSTAKSTLSKALAAGVDPDGLGKSALDKKRKKATVVKKSPEELVHEAWATFIKRLDKLPAAEQSVIVITAFAELDSR